MNLNWKRANLVTGSNENDRSCAILFQHRHLNVCFGTAWNDFERFGTDKKCSVMGWLFKKFLPFMIFFVKVTRVLFSSIFLNIGTRPLFLKWKVQNSHQWIKICHIKINFMYTTDSEWAYVMNYKHYCEIEDKKNEKFSQGFEPATLCSANWCVKRLFWSRSSGFQGPGTVADW